MATAQVTEYFFFLPKSIVTRSDQPATVPPRVHSRSERTYQGIQSVSTSAERTESPPPHVTSRESTEGSELLPHAQDPMGSKGQSDVDQVSSATRYLHWLATVWLGWCKQEDHNGQK